MKPQCEYIFYDYCKIRQGSCIRKHNQELEDCISWQYAKKSENKVYHIGINDLDYLELGADSGNWRVSY